MFNQRFFRVLWCTRQQLFQDLNPLMVHWAVYIGASANIGSWNFTIT